MDAFYASWTSTYFEGMLLWVVLKIMGFVGGSYEAFRCESAIKWSYGKEKFLIIFQLRLDLV
jgi:hypothetical protein